MPSGIFKRSQEYLAYLRENMKKVSAISSKLPRTEKQLSAARNNVKVATENAAKLPRTKKQIANAKALGELSFKNLRSIQHGYIVIYNPTHPVAISSNSNYVREHRLVIENFLGRYLTSKESVHHIDRNKQNNDISNLIAFSSESAHQRFHSSESKVKKNEIIFDGRNV